VLAHRAVANVIGDVNDVEFGVAEIYANITRQPTSAEISATVHQIPPNIGRPM